MSSTVSISLGLPDCAADDVCANLADGLYRTLSSGRYDRCSVLPMPTSIAAWMQEHRTARKRVMRSERRGYVFGELHRENHADEIHAINTSLDERQGRPMGAGYLERQEFSPLPEYPCSRHRILTSGVWLSEDLPSPSTMESSRPPAADIRSPTELSPGQGAFPLSGRERAKLVAYITTYRSGDLVLVSQILGHADHLENEVMYLLFAGALEREIAEAGFVVYNRHDSGTEGLRFFKERLGFREEAVEWLP